jgi:hypothetical protein
MGWVCRGGRKWGWGWGRQGTPMVCPAGWAEAGLAGAGVGAGGETRQQGGHMQKICN